MYRPLGGRFCFSNLSQEVQKEIWGQETQLGFRHCFFVQQKNRKLFVFPTSLKGCRYPFPSVSTVK